MFENMNLTIRTRHLEIELTDGHSLNEYSDIVEEYKNDNISSGSIRYFREMGNYFICDSNVLTSMLKKYFTTQSCGVYKRNDCIDFNMYSYCTNDRLKHFLSMIYFVDSYYNGHIEENYVIEQYPRLNSVYNFDLFNIVLMLGPNTYHLFEKPLLHTITKEHFRLNGIEFPESCLATNGISLNLAQFQNKPIDNTLIEQLKSYVTEVIKYNRKHEVK